MSVFFDYRALHGALTNLLTVYKTLDLPYGSPPYSEAMSVHNDMMQARSRNATGLAAPELLRWKPALDALLYDARSMGIAQSSEWIAFNAEMEALTRWLQSPKQDETPVSPAPTTINLDELLVERGSRYGPFPNHALITQSIKVAMHDSGGWDRLFPDQKEALEMIAHKIGRILNGDPNYTDSWQDIVGYARLVVKRLNGEPI